MKRYLVVFAFVVALLIAALRPWFYFSAERTSPARMVIPAVPSTESVVPPTSVEPPPEEPPTPEPLSVEADSRDRRTAGSPLAPELNNPAGDAVRDVDTLHALLRQYLRHLKRRPGLPIGNDSDLARALTGHNPMKLVVLPPNHPSLSADGHIRDRWGTPYFIHPRGNNAFEIRSAGADRKLFTADDVVANPRRSE